MPVILCSDTIYSGRCSSACCHELDAFFFQFISHVILLFYCAFYPVSNWENIHAFSAMPCLPKYFKMFFLSQLVKNSCCLDSICFINVFVLLRIQKFKNTPPNKTSCIRLLIYIACVTGSQLDNKSMWQQKRESQVINDNF